MKLQKTLKNLKKSEDFFFNLQNKGIIWINLDLLRDCMIVKKSINLPHESEDYRYVVYNSEYKPKKFMGTTNIKFFSEENFYCFTNTIKYKHTYLQLYYHEK